MIKLLIGLFGGTIIGIFTMCLMQVNRYKEIEKDSKDEK